jgi:hypothetical protein
MVVLPVLSKKDMVCGSTGSLNVTLRAAFGITPMSPFLGVVATMVGGIVSGTVPVLNEEM